MIGDFANSVTGRDLQDVRDDVGIAHRGMAAGTVAAIDGVAGAEVMGAMFSFSQGAWSVSPRADRRFGCRLPAWDRPATPDTMNKKMTAKRPLQVIVL